MKATFILGVLALTLSARAASAAPMHFTRGDNAYIVAEGEITEDTPSELGRLITSPGTAIYFDSPGGSLGAALTLGRMIRRGSTPMLRRAAKAAIRPASTPSPAALCALMTVLRHWACISSAVRATKALPRQQSQSLVVTWMKWASTIAFWRLHP